MGSSPVMWALQMMGPLGRGLGESGNRGEEREPRYGEIQDRIQYTNTLLCNRGEARAAPQSGLGTRVTSIQ